MKFLLILNNIMTITATKITISEESFYLSSKNHCRINLINIITIFGCFLLILNHFIDVPSYNQIHMFLSNRGPSFGFYLYIISIVILFITITVNHLKKGEKHEK